MKKCLLLALALCMLMTCALAQGTDLVGTWTISHAEAQGLTFDAQALGLSWTVELRGDKTATISMGEDSGSGTWRVENGQLLLNNGSSDLVFILSDTGFYMEEDSVKIHFVSTGEPAQPAYAAEEVKSPVGIWNLKSAEMDGRTMDSSAMGMDITFELFENGTMTASLAGDEEEGTWELDGSVLRIHDGSMAMECTYQEDTFQMVLNGINMTFARGEGAAAPAAVSSALGTWELTTLELKGNTLSPADVNASMTIQFLEDGSATAVANGEEVTGTWTLAGSELVFDDNIQPLTFTYEGDSFYVVENGVKMIFTPVNGQAPAQPAPQAQFPVGNWELSYGDYNGQIVPGDSLGVYWYTELKADGTAIQNTSGEIYEGYWKMENGGLIISDGITEMEYTIEGDVFYYVTNGVKLYFSPKAAQ